MKKKIPKKHFLGLGVRRAVVCTKAGQVIWVVFVVPLQTLTARCATVVGARGAFCVTLSLLGYT